MQAAAALDADDLEKILAVTRHLAAPFELADLLAEVTRAATQVLKAERCSVWLLDGATGDLVMRVSTDGANIRMAAGQGLVGACVLQRSALHVADCYADPRFDPRVDRGTGFHTRNSLTLPLIDHRDELVGVLQVLNLAHGAFDASDAALAAALSAQCAVALTRVQLTVQAREAERMRQGLEVARLMQAATLPKALPRLPGYDLHGHFQPAEQTGGDTYELAWVDGQLLIVLADAAGHGIGPALSAMQLHAMVRVAFRLCADLATVFRQVNDQLHELLPDGHFITAFIGLLDPATHRLRFLSGGQAPILHVRAAQGDVLVHPATSFPMGAMQIERLRPPVELVLAPGDSLVLLSDGVYEAEDADRQPFGRARVEALVRARPASTMAALASDLLAALESHAAGMPQDDDITMVLLRHVDHVPTGEELS